MSELDIAWVPAGRSGRAVLTARRGAEVLCCDTVDVFKASARDDYAEAIAKASGLSADDIPGGLWP